MVRKGEKNKIPFFFYSSEKPWLDGCWGRLEEALLLLLAFGLVKIDKTLENVPKMAKSNEAGTA